MRPLQGASHAVGMPRLRTCLTERLVYILFFLNTAFELAVRVTSHPAKSSVFVLHYYAVSLAIGICTTVAIIVALVVARATRPR